ncbi:hypothetical protein CPB84DRAFT_1775191 [Gymnopilus junonius]|uniref:Uncharacterized protein n=1 Tax=Gymnopilus junonius TaxID=109634 RepID=A0A9P5NRX1_GYMJU|nr:hypothetical protein CPB84DRAFT_1775191 [Gymnopilus junonius]
METIWVWIWVVYYFFVTVVCTYRHVVGDYFAWFLLLFDNTIPWSWILLYSILL